MNLKAKIDVVGRHDEIKFHQDDPNANVITKYFTNNRIFNVQFVEFHPNGDLVVLGLKSGILLILDFMTMAIVRVFSATEDFGLASNEDVDQFYQFWKVAYFAETDFVFKDRAEETNKDSEAFLKEKY